MDPPKLNDHRLFPWSSLARGTSSKYRKTEPQNSESTSIINTLSQLSSRRERLPMQALGIGRQRLRECRCWKQSREAGSREPLNRTARRAALRATIDGGKYAPNRSYIPPRSVELPGAFIPCKDRPTVAVGFNGRTGVGVGRPRLPWAKNHV